jgi:hypothetical protein
MSIPRYQQAVEEVSVAFNTDHRVGLHEAEAASMTTSTIFEREWSGLAPNIDLVPFADDLVSTISVPPLKNCKLLSSSVSATMRETKPAYEPIFVSSDSSWSRRSDLRLTMVPGSFSRT